MGYEDRTGTWYIYGKAPALPQQSQGEKPGLAQYKPISLAGSSRFTGYLALHFPEVVARIEEGDLGVLHLEVAAMKAASQEAILEGDWDKVDRHFHFIDSILEIADYEMHEAIGISYLTNLFYDETSLNFAKARTLLPKRLAKALELMERHYEELPRPVERGV